MTICDATSRSGTEYSAVVFDLFGTLMNAPSTQDRAQARDELAEAFGVEAERVNQALADSWLDRHLGH